MKKSEGNFIKKERLFDGNYPRVFSILLENSDWAIAEKQKASFPDKVKRVFNVLYLFGCTNTRVVIQGFHNGIILESILQDAKNVFWPYDLTNRVLEIIMLQLELKHITLSEKDSYDCYVLDQNLNIVDHYIANDDGE